MPTAELEMSEQTLLSPIDGAAPSGADLRYDPLFDQIAEARSEEDASIPLGQWERPAKKADFPLVVSLTQAALQHRSKDLWLAAWLGEAQIRQNGVPAIGPALTLLLDLQQSFWSTLHPLIEEDDRSLRAAPLHWALNSYAVLLRLVPSVTSQHSYADFKGTRAPKTPAQTEAATAVNAAVTATAKPYYAALSKELRGLSQSMEALYLFCGENYGEDGPSFGVLSSVLDDLQHIVDSTLREKRKLDPDLEPFTEPAPEAQSALLEVVHASAFAESASSGGRVTQDPVHGMEADHTPSASYDGPHRWEEELSAPDSSTARRAGGFPANTISSSVEAFELARRGALYLAHSEPGSGAAYLLLSALWGQDYRSLRSGLLRKPPASSLRSSLRAALQEAQERGMWADLLGYALDALAIPGCAAWLDLHRYIYLASSALGHTALSAAVVDWVQSKRGRDPNLEHSVFEDDTPTANEPTRAWLANLGSTQLQQGANANSVATKDLLVEAEEIAAAGDLVRSVRMLMEDAATSPARRLSFQRRLQAARLCLAAGQPDVALRLLQQMLSECDAHQLAQWEGAQLVGEVIGMLLESLKSFENGEERTSLDRKALLARLFELDPARALAHVVQN